MTTPRIDPFAATQEATAELWNRLARPFDTAETVDALLGLSTDVVEQLVGVLVATCDEAETLLYRMPKTLRTLKTSVGTHNERCVGELRGPVQWSETFAAQASSLGNRDVYVCSSTRRAYDIDENQVLVGALQSIAAAGASVDMVGDDSYEDEGLRRARANAKVARRYLDHRSLEAIRVSGRPTARAIKRTRSGKTSAAYRPALEMLDRVNEPLSLDELSPYCDRRTRVQHGVLLAIIEELEARGMRVPAVRAESGSLFAGPVEYIHPRRRGDNSRLHGIVLGHVLVDVPQRLKRSDPAELRLDLETRANGREVVPITSVDDIIPAVDTAVRAARG
ncbi:MAG: hypothetical protein R8F63_07110 [Acidimicrobiales bacterium]|nr:hypothetical protein [Acidimicrobiales bacterium]